jgi:hypothetical protein
MLNALDVDATALREEFAQSITDPSLFEQLRGRSIVYVSSDIGQTTKSHEARAMREMKMTAIYIGPFWHKLKFWDQAAWLVRHWPTIDGFANGVAKGTVAELKQNGRALVLPA